MAEKTQFDPFLVWKDMYQQSEQAWQDVIQETLGKESFAQSLGQVQSGYLQSYEMLNDFTQMYFKQLNIPTTDEIANVASLVIQVEQKVDQLDDQLFDSNDAASKEIGQLKRSITALDKKLDKVLLALTALESKVEAPAPTAKPAEEVKAETTKSAAKPATAQASQTKTEVKNTKK